MSACVMVAVTVATEPAIAFDLFTREVDSWWRQGLKYRFRPGRTGVMRFEPGIGGRLVEIYDETRGELFEVGQILAWEPGRRLAFAWRGPNYPPGQVTHVEVRFAAAAGGTRVIVEHRGWEALPPDHPARHGLPEERFLSFIGGWWREQLASFRTDGMLLG